MSEERTVWVESPSGKIIPEVSERQRAIPWCKTHKGQQFGHWPDKPESAWCLWAEFDSHAFPPADCDLSGVVWETIE